jgi:hypothetical protein
VSVIDIPPIPGVSDDLVRAINDRLRRLDSSAAAGEALTFYGTRQERGDRYKAADYTLGTVYRETDTGLRYQCERFQGAQQWAYLGGVHVAAFASRLTGLVAADGGLIWRDSTHEHLLRWTGSGWEFLDTPGGWFAGGHVAAPEGTGWALCDGGNTTYLTISAGAVAATAFTTPDASAGAYLAVGAAYAGISGTGGAGAAAVLLGIAYFRR